MRTDRGVNTVKGIFGILKSSNGFVPLSPTEPINRLKHIAKECNFDVIITESLHLDKVHYLKSIFNYKTVIVLDYVDEIEEWREKFSSISLLDQNDIESSNPIELETDGLSREENLVYTVYTSGTTGKPKGVGITHKNLMPLFYWQREKFGLGTEIKCMQTLPINFDFGIQEVFTTLCFGGTLYYTDIENILNPKKYAELLREYSINMVYTTPSYFSEIVENKIMLKDLRILLLGGEKLSKVLLRDARNILPDNCMVFNGYGPTEASINCLMYQVPNDNDYLDRYDGIQSVPIGTPTGQSQVFILDRSLNLVPILIPGEIYISGPGVAKGYLNNKELTESKFIKNPFGTGYEIMYRTGDFARYLPDGNIEFIGRIDKQVKINGYRIELNEIETILNNYPNIKESVVLVNEEQELCAFVRLEDAETIIDKQELYLYLNANLPRYMVPKQFNKIRNLPKTSNGKLDTAYLFNYKNNLFSPMEDNSFPNSDIERQISDIWKEVIGLNESLSLHDNFFDLGGHSLLLTKLQVRIEETIGVLIPLTKFFEYPTIKSLSNYIINGFSTDSDEDFALNVAVTASRRRRANKNRKKLNLKGD